MNFHTHIGRPVLDDAGHPVWQRVPSIHGQGRYRIRYEYVPIFADPAATAAVMVRRAARKAWLDARRARFAPVPRSTGEPLTWPQRSDIYFRQNGASHVTPRQRRRLGHKAGVALGRAA